MRNYFVGKLKDLKVGDKVYIACEDLRRHDPYEATVSAIGRKYVSIGENDWTLAKFSIETGIRKDWSEWYIFTSKEEYEKCLELEEKARLIRLNIQRYTLSPDDIEAIYSILLKYQKK